MFEGNPPTRKNVEDLKKEGPGLPESAFSTIERHGRLDATHKNDLNKLLDTTLPLTEKHKYSITLKMPCILSTNSIMRY